MADERIIREVEYFKHRKGFLETHYIPKYLCRIRWNEYVISIGDVWDEMEQKFEVLRAHREGCTGILLNNTRAI